MAPIRMLAARLALCPAVLLAACATPSTTDPAELSGGEWRLDAAHTSVVWQVRHMDLSWYTARFDEAEARLDFAPANPAEAQLTAIVQAESVSTGDPDFDEQLRGSAWLDASNHPEIVFRSTRIEVTGETTGRVHGEITLKGQTHDAVMETEFYGGTTNPLEGTQVVGFHGQIETEYGQYGVGSFPATNFIGGTVRLRIEAEFLHEGDTR